MKLFELNPIEEQMNSHHWQASRYKGKVIVVARDRERAKAIARSRFGIATALVLGQEVPANPWNLAGIVSCVEVEDPSINLDAERLVYPEGFDEEEDV